MTINKYIRYDINDLFRILELRKKVEDVLGPLEPWLKTAILEKVIDDIGKPPVKKEKREFLEFHRAPSRAIDEVAFGRAIDDVTFFSGLSEDSAIHPDLPPDVVNLIGVPSMKDMVLAHVERYGKGDERDSGRLLSELGRLGIKISIDEIDKADEKAS